MSVPFIDLKRFEIDLAEQFSQKVKELTENTQFIAGKEVEELEKKLIEDNQIRFAITCANGTDAIQLALRACNIGPGDIVLVPDLTFWATFEAVINVGAEPVLVDIDQDDLQMSFELFNEAINKYHPKAAILVHLYGWASKNIEDFRKTAKEKNLILIEDGAQSYRVKINGESIYKNAFVSTISFYPAKVFGAAGDAGAVLTNDEHVAHKVRSLGNHGREQHYSYSYVGWNSRLSNIQAAYLNLNFPYLSERIKSRQMIANQYREDLSKLGFNVVTPPGLKNNPYKNIEIEENGYLNAILMDSEKRNKLIEHLKNKGIGYGIVYPETISEQKPAQKYIKGILTRGIANYVTRSIINLPLFPYLTENEYEEVIQTMKEF